AQAQAATDASTDHVVVGTCEVRVARLGTVLTAPGVVGVRGAGRAYDGLYRLESVVHRIDLTADDTWDFTQSLTIAREGLGAITATLEAS
ncbi:MAG TPA: hypothetical protein VK507_13585, partial [Iamia sp.]|nr:hypothetical protein [Iamia sp.]